MSQSTWSLTRSRYQNGPFMDLTPFRMVKGYKGYGIFVKGVAYDPPHFLKEETLE